MASSFAIWCESLNHSPKVEPTPKAHGMSDNGADREFETHINLWDLEENVQLLDFGLKFFPDGPCTLKIYIPFPVNEDNIFELGSLITSQRDLLAAIFNEDIKKIKFIDENCAEISFSQTSSDGLNEKLLIHCNHQFTRNGGDVGSRVTLQKYGDGEIITFNIKDLQKKARNISRPHYIRFRLRLNKNNISLFKRTYQLKDKFFVSRKESVEIIDFRINERRILPGEIRNFVSMPLAKLPNFYHFFLIRNAQADYVQSHNHDGYAKCRILERETWSDYLEKTNPKFRFNEDTVPVIYHWRNDKVKGGAFSSFAKFKFTKTSYLHIAMFSVFIITLGAISSYIAEPTFDYITNHITSALKSLKKLTS